MKKTKKEVPTVNKTVDTSKESEIIGKDVIPNLVKKSGKILNDPNSKLNETLFNNAEASQSKPIESMRKTLDEMKAAALKVSFVSVKDIPENETLPIRVGDSYIALDKLDIQMVFEWVALKLVDIAKEKAKKDHSDQVRITVKGLGTIIFGRNDLSGIVTHSNIYLPALANDYNTRCSENDCNGCPYNKVCSLGR